MVGGDGAGGDPFGLKALLGAEGLESASAVERGEAALQARRLFSILYREYGGVIGKIGEFAEQIDEKRKGIEDHIEESRVIFDPNHGKPFARLADFGEYPTLGRMRKTASELHSHFELTYQTLFRIADLYAARIKPLSENGSSPAVLSDLSRTVEVLNIIIKSTAQQLVDGVINFEAVVTRSYIEIQTLHRRLRSKYQGVADHEEDDKDEVKSLLRELVGMGRNTSPQPATGPRLELVGDNCVLTDTLESIANNLPKRIERTMPVGRNGRTKVVRHLDEWDIQRHGDALIQLANTEYMLHLQDPNSYVAKIAEMIQHFYLNYDGFEPLIRAILSARTDIERQMSDSISGKDKHIADPSLAIRRMQRYNFLSIVPNSDEVAPRTKVERDYAIARRNLLHHLNATLETLAGMPDETEEGQLEKETAATEAVRKAVGLKEIMDDISRTERERGLRKDIRGENEFYVGRTGRIGEFYSEREPAPRIRYKDVAGASFDAAKAHVEEVISIASFPHTLQASAPRGSIKSNILLIGPYGCGKTEFARAVAGDPRVIGLYVGVSDVLTAYMHESVKNVKRVWEEAKRLRQASRRTKPVAVVLDEFDGWFERGDLGFRMGDVAQMERTLQETMDGLVEYEGVFSIALTNRPGSIPDAILRRFKYVNIVGQLTDQERMGLFRKFLSRGMPLSRDIGQADYQRWAAQLKDAPGDVLGKVADEVHFKLMSDYRHTGPRGAKGLERILAKRSKENGSLGRSDYALVKRTLAASGHVVTRENIDAALTYMLRQPAVQKEIIAAREVYREADKIMQGLATVDGVRSAFGLSQRSRLFEK